MAEKEEFEIGNRFNYWTVIDDVNPIPSSVGAGFILCCCDCGEIRYVSKISLLRGKTKSCGCMGYEKTRERKTKISKDIVGEVFGRLTVVEKIGSERLKSGKTKVFFKCLCVCGKYTKASMTELTSGATKSCGCYIKEILGNSLLTENLTEQKFGNLTVIGRVRNEDESSSKKFLWRCVCICGNTIDSETHCLTKGKIKSCGCLSESWIASELKKYCKEKYTSISEYRILKNPETGYFLPYDIYIPSYKIFIEVNGSQHYLNNNGWNYNDEIFEYSKHKDKLKKQYAKKNGIFIEIDLRKIKTLEQAIEKIEKIITSRITV